MIAEISAGVAAAKGAIATAKNLLNLKTEAERNAAIIEIQSQVLDVQSQLSEAQRRYDELLDEKRKSDAALAARDDWDREARKYKLSEPRSGFFVYELIDAANERVHWLCPNCFQQRMKSILFRPIGDHEMMLCQNCKMQASR